MGVKAVADVRADLEADGFREIAEHPRRSDLVVGARVRNRGEQYPKAMQFGTAVVVAIMRRGTDEHPDSWERTYGRPNIEVIVECDADRSFPGATSWADYGTHLAEGDL